MNPILYIRNEPEYNQQETSVNKAESLLNQVLTNSNSIEPVYETADNISGGIAKATELVLWQLSNLEKMQKQAVDDILKTQCQVSTDLERLHQLGSRFINPSDNRAAQLKDRLATLEEKRRKVELDFFDRQSKCLEKLVTLVGRHKLLTPPQYR